MKKTATLKFGDKEYTFCYTLGSMRKIEREIGKSLISVVLKFDSKTDQRVGIDFIIANFRHAVQWGKEVVTDDKIYDIIDDYCDHGGTLDLLGGFILRSLYETGFFIPNNLANQVEEKKKK